MAVKMYFKGGEGIQNPVDINGQPIEKGDILTHDWFEGDKSSFWKQWYPDWDAEKIQQVTHEPNVIVKRDEKGILFGEGLKEVGISGGKAYLHDFRFKYTKIVSKASKLSA